MLAAGVFVAGEIAKPAAHPAPLGLEGKRTAVSLGEQVIEVRARRLLFGGRELSEEGVQARNGIE